MAQGVSDGNNMQQLVLPKKSLGQLLPADSRIEKGLKVAKALNTKTLSVDKFRPFEHSMVRLLSAFDQIL